MVPSVARLALLALLSGGASAEVLVLEGSFGRVEVNAEQPSLLSLTLRRADGSLEPHSLLSPKGAPWMRGMPDWGTEALTFAVDASGNRFESRNHPPESVERSERGIALRGVLLTDGKGEAVAREDWTLTVEDGSLVWTVARTWLRGLETPSVGTPALFLSTRPISSTPSTILPNSVATALWIEPESLRGWHNPLYRPAEFGWGYKLTPDNNVVVAEPGGWAVLKLFPAWQNEREPRLSVEGGHLYRRGHFGWLSEVGIVTSPEPLGRHRTGETERTTLRIAAVPARATGHQLSVEAEDPSGTVEALRHYYGALLNGGCVNDQLRYHFGNEPDGWYYGGASWMKGLPMLAGVPASGAASSRPWELPRAFRDNLAAIVGTEFEPGRTRFGYNSAGHGAVGGAYTDDNIIQVIGGRAYYLYSGDLAFVRQQLPFYRRAVTWYLDQRNAEGLVSLTPAHWYYDAMLSSGATTYHNTFLYRALTDLAGLEAAAGNAAEAAAWLSEAAALKDAINRLLWSEEASGGPRYVDWIQPDGTKITYAADLCQFPPLAFGIASPEQARRLLDTLDRRIVELRQDGAAVAASLNSDAPASRQAELRSDRGYAGYASLSAYWPVPSSVNTHPANQGFGSYMNGGSFLCMTYWEIMARCAAGDAEGAWERLSRFAEGTRLTGAHGFTGNNWVMQDGRIGYGACDEPYLSDAIAVPGALVQGILGIRQTNEALEVRPVLPAALRRATVEVMHLGRRKRVTIDGESVRIDDLGRGFRPPRELTWRIDAGCPEEAALYIGRTFGAEDGCQMAAFARAREGAGVVLERPLTGPLGGLWKLDDAHDGVVSDSSGAHADGRTLGAIALGAPDRRGEPSAAGLHGAGYIQVSPTHPFMFDASHSFTIQAWFRTASVANMVIASRPGAYSLGVKDGQLSAWIMQSDGQFVEATGVGPAADGAWHHAAAVYDRSSETLSVYLDGQLDGAPLSIAAIGASASAAPLTIGAFGGSFPFEGSLDEISIHRVALSPESFSTAESYAPPVEPEGSRAVSGSYTAAPCDWGQSVLLSSLRTDVSLGGGTLAVLIEVSDDGFRTVSARCRLELPDGVGSLALDGLPPARGTRLTFRLRLPACSEASPVLRAAELTAVPAEGGPA